MAKNKITPDKTMVDMARKLKEIRDQVGSLEAQAEALEEQAAPLEQALINQIVEVFGEIGGSSFDVSDKVKAILVTKSHPRILSGHEQEVHQWIKDNGFPSAVKEYVFPATFKSIMKDVADTRKVDIKDVVNRELLSAVEVYIQKTIQFRKKA